MNPSFRKVVLALAILGLAISIGVAACGGGDDETATTTATTTTAATSTAPESDTTGPVDTSESTTPPTEQTPFTAIRITVKGGRPVGGIQRPKVNLGDNAIIYVTSDVADEVHFHGYDLSQDVKAGGTAQIPFHATVPGRFEIELENSGVQLAELTVS
jgi:hypothetical protein